MYTINIDGTGLKKLITTPYPSFRFALYSVSYSPDGTLIAFTGRGPEDKWAKIYIIDADRKNLRRLTKDDPLRGELEYSWSPDGKKIAFSGMRYDPEKKDFNYGIYTVNIDGSDPRLICPTENRVDWLAWRPRPKSLKDQNLISSFWNR
ncbi:MAG: hypothetical protein AB1297_01170 [bacterium]